MDTIERNIRERLHHAGEEMTVRPLREGSGGRVPHRTLRPLFAAVAFAVVVGGVAAGVGVHSRLGARHATTATTPPPAPPTALPTPAAPTPQAAPYLEGYGNVVAAWDSTHGEVVLYAGGSGKTNTAATVWTWRGTWQQVTPGGTAAPESSAQGPLADAPGLHGVALIEAGSGYGGNWLWDGAKWSPLPTQSSEQCMNPRQAVWDAKRGQLLVVLVDQCTGGTTIIPSQTWTFDGRGWQRRADLPSDPNVSGVVAWDPELNTVVLIGGANGGTRAWTWNGSAWIPGPSARIGFGGGTAAWDARLSALVVWDGNPGMDGSTQPNAIAFSKCTLRELPQSAGPERTGAVFADATDGRLLAIGSEPVPSGTTPPPYHYGAPGPDEFLLLWTGATWMHVTDLATLRLP